MHMLICGLALVLLALWSLFGWAGHAVLTVDTATPGDAGRRRRTRIAAVALAAPARGPARRALTAATAVADQTVAAKLRSSSAIQCCFCAALAKLASKPFAASCHACRTPSCGSAAKVCT